MNDTADKTTEDTTPTGHVPPTDDRAVSIPPAALEQEPHTEEQLQGALNQLTTLEGENAALRLRVKEQETELRTLRQRITYLEANTNESELALRVDVQKRRIAELEAEARNLAAELAKAPTFPPQAMLVPTDTAEKLGVEVPLPDWQCTNCGKGYTDDEAVEQPHEEYEDGLVIRCTCGGALRENVVHGHDEAEAFSK